MHNMNQEYRHCRMQCLGKAFGSGSCVALKMVGVEKPKERDEKFRDKGDSAPELNSQMSRARGRTAWQELKLLVGGSGKLGFEGGGGRGR